MAGYPVGEASRTGWLPVGDGHELYWEEAGNPDGVPALVLHGGPGSGFSESMRRVFDPRRYRIIGFDQRNAKRSRPSAAGLEVDLSANTTWHLVEDIERLRVFFGVSRWVLFGTSWGTTLGLAYAETHPDRVAAMAFAGVTIPLFVDGARKERTPLNVSVFPRLPLRALYASHDISIKKDTQR